MVRAGRLGTASSTPVTVTVCATFQSAAVNVSAPDTRATAESPLSGVTVTAPVGCDRSTTS